MTAVEEDEEASKKVEEDEDDWDLVEAPGGEEKYVAAKQSTSLFARGVVDRYRLAVFRKSTPSRSRPSSARIPLDAHARLSRIKLTRRLPQKGRDVVGRLGSIFARARTSSFAQNLLPLHHLHRLLRPLGVLPL